MKHKLFLLLWCIICIPKIYAQKQTNNFIDHGITYEITAVAAVSVIDYDESLGTDVVIPNNVIYDDVSFIVTTIGSGAFREKNLTSVVIPNSISLIGDLAFDYNDLTNIVIPDSVTDIGLAAFANNNLTSVILPSSITCIESASFSYNNLTSIVVPDSVTSIGNTSFTYNNLTSVVIPKSVTNIGYSAFANNDLINITLPDSPMLICEGAFLYNKLTSITIPNSRIEIEAYAFYHNDLETIVSNCRIPVVLHSNAFDNRSNINLIIPVNTTQVYMNENWTGFKTVTEQEVLSVDELVVDNISIRTNNNILNVVTNNDVAVVGIKVYTGNGALVKESSKTNINITSLNKGVYIVCIQTNKGAASKKVTIQ